METRDDTRDETRDETRDDKAARRGAALRENLKRRKAQARAAGPVPASPSLATPSDTDA